MASNTDLEFQKAMALCRDIFRKKLYDYKPSWRMMRPESLTDQLFIKAKRIRTLEITKETKVGEGILPEFMAIINYGITSLIQLEKGFACPPSKQASTPWREASQRNSVPPYSIQRWMAPYVM